MDYIQKEQIKRRETEMFHCPILFLTICEKFNNYPAFD